MTEIKPGDNVNIDAWHDVRRVLARYGEWLWLTPKGDDGRTIPAAMRAQFVSKVEPFFEAGKRYKYASLRFECTHVMSDYKGKVAVGYDTNIRDSIRYITIRREFGSWTEAV